MRDRIRDEEERLKKNLQQEMKLKEIALEKQLRRNLKEVEQEHGKKMKEYQQRLLAEEMRLKKTQSHL